MKTFIAYISLTIFWVNGLFPQSTVEHILNQIEQNNTTLAAFQNRTAADKIRASTGNSLQNPQAEYNRLWGSPALIGNRTDVSITQSFDFPSAYAYRHAIANSKSEQAELLYLEQVLTIRLKAGLLCMDIIYTNALLSELSSRVNDANRLCTLYGKKLSNGESNLLEYNKAQLALLTASKAFDAAQIDKNALISELIQLNGGVLIELNDTVYPLQTIPANFEEWYVLAEQTNPGLRWLTKEMDISTKQEKLALAKGLPKFEVGYMSEKVVGEQFQGITVGLSIPLWENKNEVKHARAISLAVQRSEKDNKHQFYSHLKRLHQNAVSLQSGFTDYRSKIERFNNTKLLQIALEKGEISLLDYILEKSLYYESKTTLLEMERKVNRSITELNLYR